MAARSITGGPRFYWFGYYDKLQLDPAASGYYDIESSVAVQGASDHSHIDYSDDHGASWRIGGVAQTGTNESAVVETTGGALYLNCRNYVGARRRACAWSYDGGLSFPRRGYEEALPEPICQN